MYVVVMCACVLCSYIYDEQIRMMMHVIIAIHSYAHMIIYAHKVRSTYAVRHIITLLCTRESYVH